MYFKNLTELMKSDSRGKAYYDSLPGEVQTALSLTADSIHSLQDMHRIARSKESVIRQNILNAYSEMFGE